jgi:GT2 family glycosyltransferase
MSLLIMASYVTETNNRLDYAVKTMYGLLETVDFNKHQLFISDNGSCKEMLNIYREFEQDFRLTFVKHPENLTIHYNKTNLGTAEAVNLGIKEMKPNQFVIKLDSDITIGRSGWVEEMEECFERYPDLGILGLKRTEVEQKADHHKEQYRTTLMSLPHQRGQSWIVVELCEDIIGTCTMYNHKLIDKVGFLIQPSVYGWDDCIMSVRSKLAGFENAFLPSVPIVHLDDGEGEYVKLKQRLAGQTVGEFAEMIDDYKSGIRDIYYNPFQ